MLPTPVFSFSTKQAMPLAEMEIEMNGITQELFKTALANDATIPPGQRKAINQAIKGTDTNSRPTLISRKKCGEILDCSTKTVDRYIERGLIQEIRFTARRIRFDESKILRLAREGVGHE